jgi:glucose/arabinose dehydrogenase
MPAALPRTIMTLARPSSARRSIPVVATLLALAGGVASAQGGIDKLQTARIPAVDARAAVSQSGREADAIRAWLKGIKLPPGFSIELYALAPDARALAVAPGTDTLFVGTRKSTVWVVTRRDAGGKGVEVRPFAPGAKFTDPNGVCFTKDGTLVVAERGRVLAFPAAASAHEGSDVAMAEIVASGRLVAPEEPASAHGARTCRVGPDDKVYVTIGEPHNVQPRAKVETYRAIGIGGIVRWDLDGTHREVFATGIRNSVGEDFDPRDGTLWFTDNQTDLLGDDQPPGELNHATKAGQDFGYPYWNGHFKVAGSSAAPDLKDLPEPKGAVFPEAEFPAHQAQLGMTFSTSRMFPDRYRHGVFVAAHGSWNRTVPTGALVDFVPIADGHAGKPEVFAEGWLGADGKYLGRPVDVAVARDGSLLVSDDYAGAIYRVTYQAP